MSLEAICQEKRILATRSQRFRPQKRELNEEQQSDIYDPYYSPPETFMPSGSSDAISVGLPKPNTSPSVEPLVSQY